MPSALRLLFGTMICCLLCAEVTRADTVRADTVQTNAVQANRQTAIRASQPGGRADPRRRPIDAPSGQRVHFDPAVEPAAFQRTPPAAKASKSESSAGGIALSKKGEPLAISPSGAKGKGPTSTAKTSSQSLVTVAVSLAIVLGLFFLVAWLMRRGMPRGGQTLPTDVLEVLGRMPLPGRQQLQLLRFGNKLLLVSLAPGVAETLAEISDPTEIDRLTGLCQQSRSGSATAVFRNMLQQISSDRKPTKPAETKPAESMPDASGARSVRDMLEEHNV
jgi:flagellar biogenesis protein FliO